MLRDKTLPHKIALLATGDEIIKGSILNTNSQVIAQKLLDANIRVGTHLSVGDNKEDIVQALAFLTQHHDCIILTGGLGPTSDDLTRFALSEYTHETLLFNDAAWDNILARFKKIGIEVPPTTNKQQALFPSNATILPNPNGTAAGCEFIVNAKTFYMLPGPPNECLPMLDSFVLPRLQELGFSQPSFRKNWYLFGASEGKIAEEMDGLIDGLDVITSYRISYPYVEFKIESISEKNLIAAKKIIQNKIAPYLINKGHHKASDYLQEWISSMPLIISIDDPITGGKFESLIRNPKNHHKIFFHHHVKADITIQLTGLKNFWEEHAGSLQTTIGMSFEHKDYSNNLIDNIPFRGPQVKDYAVEWVCKEILNCIQQLK